MTATNHALTGAIIGLTVHNPLLALPAALLSHIVCDIIPHWAHANPGWIGTKAMKLYLLADAALCGLLVLVLYLSSNPNWLLASFCAFLATSPDFLWIRKFRSSQHGQKLTFNKLETFLSRIQWFQKPIGGYVEAAWAISATSILLGIL